MDIMDLSSDRSLNTAQRCLAAAWGVLCILIIAAPILALLSFPIPSAIIYFSFSGVCHQIPERSFWVSGQALAVCHRCSGIYLGLFLGSLIKFRIIHRSPRRRRNILIVAIVALMLDALLPHAGLWSNTTSSRFLTGLLFGIIGSSILLRGAAEFLREHSRRRLPSSLCISKGGLL
jgi:uncharacterized membrane protein